MPYKKPGVEISQIQESVSPNLTEPALIPVMVGEGYKVSEIDEMLNYDAPYNYEYPNIVNITDSITISGLDSEIVSLDPESVYVDLVSKVTGDTYGDVKHLIPEQEFSVDHVNNTITISSGIDSTVWAGAGVRVGYRAQRLDLDEILTTHGIQDVKNRVGKICADNPLAMGLRTALVNGNVPVKGYGVNTTNQHSAALDELALHEVYAMVPLSQDSTDTDLYQTHVTSMSNAENKKERIALISKKINWADSSGNGDAIPGNFYDGFSDVDMSKTGTAQVMQAETEAIGNRRVFISFPDVVWVKERRHVSTIKEDYLNNINGNMKLQATLETNVTLINDDTTTYYKGTKVTEAVWANLAAIGENTFYDVKVPVPAYYLNAAVAGAIGGQLPQQGFTNAQFIGVSGLQYSNQTFNTSQLNTIARGGNMIFVQSSSIAPILCRHQLSTDVSSVETQELSITKQLDFVAKFIRSGLEPYIGRKNITPAYLKLLAMILGSQCAFLRNIGAVVDLKPSKPVQDPNASDTILVDVDVAVAYPVNYIKIKLVF